jgi:L-aminoadipate-semialdehyde dehydrogenase
MGAVGAASLLSRLGLQARNAGVCAGPQAWRGAGPPLVSINPSDESVLAEVVTATAADYDAVLASAVAAGRAWREVPAPRRGEAVRRLGVLLREHKDALGTLIALENGKIKAEGDGEVQEMIDIADLAVGQAHMLYGKTMHSERPAHRMYEQWHPLGVVGVITAFNFPVAVWAWNALLAAVCGNATVWKPSPKTPLVAIGVQHLCNRIVAELDLPPIFTLLIDAGREAAARLATDPRVALLSFTGSSAVGRQIAQVVAGRFGRCLLECSGNNAIVVAADADLDLVIPAVVFGAAGTAGQRCTTTRRLLVHESIEAEVVRRLVAAYSQLRVGDPCAAATLMGPLIDAAAVAGFRRAVEEALAAGGNLVCGGKARSGPGFFVEPTIIADARNDWPVVQRETFAPILYVLRYRDLEEAISLHNSVPQGLSSAIFTRSLREAERFLSAAGSDCGIANVNLGTSGAEIGGAFGGEKETGGGREAGSDAWQAYMRRQTNTINWSRELPLAQGIVFGSAPSAD